MKLQNDRQNRVKKADGAVEVVQTFKVQREKGRLGTEEFSFVIYDEQSKADQSAA